MRTLHEDLYTFMIISCWILLRLRMFQTKVGWENQNTHFTFDNVSENHAIYERMWKNMLEPDRPQMTMIQCMHFACLMTKARIQTHSKYVIFIVFPQQQWLCECAWILCYAYIACLVISDPLPKVGEVAVITGGARGIGVEVVKKLLQCGIHVVIGM
jgi:3-oxoacyl-ACP reductase-like protein